MTSPQLADRLMDMTAIRPAEWAPPAVPGPRARTTWIGIAAVLIAVAALAVAILAFTRTGPAAVPSATSVSPTAAAKARVCSTFTEVTDSLRFATSQPEGSEPFATDVNARAAIVAGALSLTRSISDATPPAVSEAANGLANAYMGYALSLFAGGAGDKAPVADAVAATRQACQ